MKEQLKIHQKGESFKKFKEPFPQTWLIIIVTLLIIFFMIIGMITAIKWFI
jgi:hypothetical protein